jgi:uncharacterized protein YegL
MKKNPSNRARRERGTVMVYVAGAMVGLVGALGVATDTGSAVMAQAALQDYVDAKVLAHTKEIFGLPMPPVNIQEFLPWGDTHTNLDEDTDVLKGGYNFGRTEFRNGAGVAYDGVPASHIAPHTIQHPTLLGRFFGIQSVELTASATAYVRRRHIVIVQDVSGSMGGSAIADSRNALNGFVDVIHGQDMPGDMLALVTFGHSGGAVARVQAGLELLDNAAEGTLHNRIDALRAEGSTPTHEGLRVARGQIEADADPLSDHMVILVSDGNPNDEGAAMAEAERICDLGNVQYNVVDIGGDNELPSCGLARYSGDSSDMEEMLMAILSTQRVRLIE